MANRVIPDEEFEKMVSLEKQNELSRKRKSDEDRTEEEYGSTCKRNCNESLTEEENGSGSQKNCVEDRATIESDQDSVSEVSEQLSQELNGKGKEKDGQIEGSVSSTPSESNLSQTTNPINVYTLNLALPFACMNENVNKSNEQEEEEFPLAKALNETAVLYKESILKSIGPKHLYTLLPRQCEINAYKYVKEDVGILFGNLKLDAKKKNSIIHQT